MPRIAYLYSRYPVVSQTFCDSEMLALESMGFDLEVVSLNPPPDSFRHERLDRLNAEIHYPAPDAVLDAEAESTDFEAKLGPLIAAHDARYGASFKSRVRARNAWHFAAKLKRLGVSHVHVHFANRATHSALFLKRLGFTFSFTAHAQDFMVDLGSDDLLREMVHESELVVMVSDFSRQLLLQTCPGNEHKVVRIYNGIELDDFPSATPDKSGVLKLVSVGRLIEFKGFQHLIGAVRLLKDRGVRVEASIIGEGPLRAELESLIQTADLADSVFLLGVRSQDQIKALLAAAHVFVHPGIVDSKGASDILPTVITEAMAARLPVVSTTVAGIPEMVVHGETGLLVPPNDEESLATAISTLDNQPALRRQYGENGRKRSESVFSLAVTAGVLAGHFRDITGSTAALTRAATPVVYYLHGEHSEALQDLPQDSRLRCIIAGYTKGQKNPSRPTAYVPDAVVLESLWLRRPAWRQVIEKNRAVLGDSISSEAFYTQARRAIWLAETLGKRSTRVLHAFRSDSMITVWLWKKITGQTISAAVEQTPSISRQVLQKLLKDFDHVSVSDEKLAGSAYQDVLKLDKPATHQTIKLGPLKVKRRLEAASVDRKPLENAWFERLLNAVTEE